MKQKLLSPNRLAKPGIMARNVALTILAASAWFIATLSLPAQGYAIKWGNFGGGGGSSTGSVYSALGTIGQPDAGQQRTEDYQMSAGFWSVAVAVSLDDGPKLRILPGGRLVTVAWPDPSTGFQLQQSPTLSPPVWKDIDTVPTIVGTEKQVRVALQPGSQFFRLQRLSER